MKILFEQQNLNQIRDCLVGPIQIWHHFFNQKILKISIIFKIEIYQFYDYSEPKKWK